MNVERLSFFGLGRLGLTLAALFARSGVRTVGIDTDAALVDRLRAGVVPLIEPGLDTLLEQAAPRLTYTADPQRAAHTDASIVLVGTPSDSVEPAYSSVCVERACRDLCDVLRARPVWRYHTFVISSTLWPGTTKAIAALLEDALGRRAGKDFGVAYVPEFVALGELVHGFEHPPFLLVGTDDDAAAAADAAALYGKVAAPSTPVRFLASRDAELAKMALNVFSCMKISFANSLAQLAERLGGVDLEAVVDTLSLDPRVGIGRMRPGTPYGGTCLPRDVDAFLHLAQSVDLAAPLVSATAATNASHYDLIERCVATGEPRCVAVLGLSFKSGTSVTGGSPAFEFVRRLLRRVPRIVAFDPIAKARDAARAAFGAAVTVCDTLHDAVAEADTILICNRDACFAELAAQTPADRRIVDPWGCVAGAHPGLVRPGQMSGGADRINGVPARAPSAVG